MAAQALPVLGDGTEEAEDEEEGEEERLERLREELRERAPRTAEEFMVFVRMEAESLPQVMTAPNAREILEEQRQRDREAEARTQGGEFGSSGAGVVCDARMCGDKAWERRAVVDFVELRQYMAALRLRGVGAKDSPFGERVPVPPMRATEAWEAFLFGPQGHPPTMQLVLQLDQPLTARLLDYQDGWLRHRTRISNARAAWLYATLANMDLPMLQEHTAIVRSIYCQCCALRAKLPPLDHKQEGQDPDTVVDIARQLAALNLLIVLTGSFFGQGEAFLDSSTST